MNKIFNSLLSSVLLAATVFSVSSCKTEENPNKAFNTNTVSLLASYMNMSLSDAADKIEKDFDLTTSIITYGSDKMVKSASDCEDIKAYADSNEKIYLVYYTRSKFVWPQSTLLDIAKRISKDVNNYFTQTHPCTYKEGDLMWKSGSGSYSETYTTHATFVHKLDSIGTALEICNEKWNGPNNGRGKEWYMNIQQGENSSSNYIEIKLSND